MLVFDKENGLFVGVVFGWAFLVCLGCWRRVQVCWMITFEFGETIFSYEKNAMHRGKAWMQLLFFCLVGLVECMIV